MPGATDRDRGYWRDVGTLDAYYDAHMDLISVHPIFNLYNHDWPIHTWPETAPAGQVRLRRGGPARARASTRWSAPASSSPGGVVRRSILSPRVHLHSYAQVEDSILMHGVEVGRQRRRAHARSSTRTSIVGEGAQIGVDPEADRERFPSPTAASSSSPRASGSTA